MSTAEISSERENPVGSVSSAVRRITVASPRLHKLQVRHFLVANVVSFVLAIGCIVWTIFFGVKISTLAIAFIFYFLTGASIEVGFHRCFAHGTFKVPGWLRAAMAAFAVMAAQGPTAYWVGNHRRHHSFPDRDGDPHSPRDGFWHAHFLWMLDREVTFTPRFAADMLQDPAIRWIDARYYYFVIGGLIVPGLLAVMFSWSWQTFVSGVLWGGGMRMFFVQHGTFAVNSICHRFGGRPFRTADLATNVSNMSWLSFGQSLHNNHHAFPSSATMALLRGEIDPGSLILLGLAKLGLATDIQTPAQSAVEGKLASAGDVRRVRIFRFSK